jgi:hypothetical protein
MSCYQLKLPVGSTYAAGAAVFMAPICEADLPATAGRVPRKHTRGDNSAGKNRFCLPSVCRAIWK